MTLSNSRRDSAIRFYIANNIVRKAEGEMILTGSSNNTWSYSLSAVQNMILVTLSKQ
jgi:uncharacterized heparinase superfamily protein